MTYRYEFHLHSWFDLHHNRHIVFLRNNAFFITKLLKFLKIAKKNEIILVWHVLEMKAEKYNVAFRF